MANTHLARGRHPHEIPRRYRRLAPAQISQQSAQLDEPPLPETKETPRLRSVSGRQRAGTV